MSKLARTNRPAPRPRKPAEPKVTAPTTAARHKNLMILVLIAFLAAIPFSMGKYFEFNSPDPWDSGAYVYSAEHILSGAGIGFEEKPSAQMGTLLVNMLGVWLFGFNETGPKLLQTVFQITAFVLMFITVRRLFGTLAAAVSVVIASVYLSAPLIAKFGNVKEQHMIAFMVMGISCFVLHQLGGKWWLALLAGAFVAWGPMFKQTGLSAIAAIGLFVLVQPLLGHRNWRQTGKDILLLVAGAVTSTAPVFLWAAGTKAPIDYWPYSFVFKPVMLVFAGPGTDAIDKPESAADKTAPETGQKERGLLRKLLPGYVTDSWAVLGPAARKEIRLRVFRYYSVLILPIALAIGSIAARLATFISERLTKSRNRQRDSSERFVLLFAVWWFFDMAFVWISPHSYVQYYLPLNASAAMLGGYAVGLYWDKAGSAVYKTKWVAAGAIAFLVMIIMSWHVFFGITRSPYTGTFYGNAATGYHERQEGYLQRLTQISRRRAESLKGYWEFVGEYIRAHSQPTDTIYVWGWFPGIYVSAQRFSSAPKAFEGTMHTLPPKTLSERVQEILTAFDKRPPKFIVDSRKVHFPGNRPPLELWPSIEKQFLPPDKKVMDEYDAAYSKLLREKIGPDEALRYEAMRPFREFVMSNYRIVNRFDEHVLFVRK